MANSKNNEQETVEMLKQAILPYQDILQIGGSRPNSPDIIIYDTRGSNPPSNASAPKAHYIISDQKLFIHSENFDPYLLNTKFNMSPITDKLVRLSKRSSGATRLSNAEGGGSLGPADTRKVSMGLRFWANYPKDGYIDLRDESQRDAMYSHMFNLAQTMEALPLVTIDAKDMDSTQCTGPNIVFDGEFHITGTGLSEETETKIVSFLRQNTHIMTKLHYYTETLGVTSTKFTVVSDDMVNTNCCCVPESVYNQVQFNEPLQGACLNLSSETFKREVPIGEFFV